MFRPIQLLCSLALLFLALVSSADAAPVRTVWILSNGFHSAFALRVEDAGPMLRSTVGDPQARWVVVGWGDKEFFMAKKFNPWIVIQAVFWPTPSALHVVPLRDVPEKVFRRSEIVRVPLSEEQLHRLQRYLDSQFARDPAGHALSLGSGFSAGSRFFLGIEKFYFPKMCNMWVAIGLKRAGVRVSPALTIAAPELMREVRKAGTRTGGLAREADAF